MGCSATRGGGSVLLGILLNEFVFYELFTTYSHLSDYVPVDTKVDENNINIPLLFIKVELRNVPLFHFSVKSNVFYVYGMFRNTFNYII